MKLLDFVVRDAVLVDLQATGKEEAIREMVGSLHRAGQLADNDMESVIRAILGREELGSTGIGQGVAVPHTRHPTLQQLDRHGGPVAPRGRFRGPGRRAGQHLLPAGLAPESARRPPAGPGEYLPTLEGRAVREFPAAGADARERDRCPGGSRPRGALSDRRRPRARRRPGRVGSRNRRPRPSARPSPPAGAAIPKTDPGRPDDPSPVATCPRPRPIEPPMSHDTTVAHRQVEITQQPRPARAARQQVRRAGVAVPGRDPGPPQWQ